MYWVDPKRVVRGEEETLATEQAAETPAARHQVAAQVEVLCQASSMA
jgi:hypothetical protein